MSERTFWQKKWEAGDIRFHKETVNPLLEKFGHQLPKGPVLVPLCGKTLDLTYFENQGRKVIGVELSPLACRAFFEENQKPHTVSQNGNFTVFAGENITLWCGDFFKLEKSPVLNISGIYDRAALIALPPELRKKYATHLRELSLAPLLLIALEYPEGSAEGPPFSVTESEVRSLYENVTVLERNEDIEITKNHPKFQGASGVFESVYLVQ